MPANQHIRDFLQYYVSLQVPPRYAVMIKGTWGSGKTHLITEIRKEVTPSPLYVSLNGISSIKEIEQEFFRQLHPVLSNPKVRLAAKLIQGALKATVNIDLDKDTKPEGSTQLGLPDLDLSKYATGPNGFFIIFDDLERCQIPLTSLLGYINYFVEHEDCKVVIVADESRIVSSNSSDDKQPSDYDVIREKVIGKTLEVELDIDAALNSFINDIANIHAKTAVERNVDFVKKILVASTYKNLRHIRQAFLDFSRLVDSIQLSDYKPDMLRSLLGTLIMYSLEIRAAFFTAEDIDQLRDEAVKVGLKGSPARSRLSILREKYGQTDVLNSFIPEAGWKELFTKGAIAPDLLNRYILTSKFYAREEDRPVWLRLWEIYTSDDDQLARAIDAADKKLKAKEFDSLAELLNITGSLLDLSVHGVYPMTRHQIVARVKECIDDMADKNKLHCHRDLLDLDDDVSFGRRHHSRESPEYKEIITYLRDAERKVEIESFEHLTGNMVRLIPGEIEAFGEQLNSAGHDSANYLYKPILSYANIDLFHEQLRLAQAVSLSKLAKILKERYRGAPVELSREVDWLKQLGQRVESLKDERTGTMAAFWLNILLQQLQTAVHEYDARSKTE